MPKPGSKKVNPSKKPKVTSNGLSDKQILFCHEYVADKELDAGEAALKAGYKAKKEGSRLLSVPEVNAYVTKLLNKRVERCEVKAERIIEELSFIGFSDPKDLFEEDGINLKKIINMPPSLRRSISSVKVNKRMTKDGPITTVDIRFWNKIEALSLLAKHIGVINDEVKVTHGVSDDLLEKLLYQVENKRTEVSVVNDDHIKLHLTDYTDVEEKL